jgi:hypothetical protein
VAKPLTISVGLTARIRASWIEDGGVINPPSDASADSSDMAIATAALADNGAAVDVTAVADGACVVSLRSSDGDTVIEDVIPVTVGTGPAVSSVALDTAGAVFLPTAAAAAVAQRAPASTTATSRR